MDIKVEGALIASLLGLLGGIIGSLVAPWVNWGIEKRREKMKYRRDLVQKWRDAIEKDFDQLAFNDTALYASLRPHLSKDAIDAIEGDQITIRVGRGGNIIKSQVLDDIAKLEKKWDLI